MSRYTCELRTVIHTALLLRVWSAQLLYLCQLISVNLLTSTADCSSKWTEKHHVSQKMGSSCKVLAQVLKTACFFKSFLMPILIYSGILLAPHGLGNTQYQVNLSLGFLLSACCPETLSTHNSTAIYHDANTSGHSLD